MEPTPSQSGLFMDQVSLKQACHAQVWLLPMLLHWSFIRSIRTPKRYLLDLLKLLRRSRLQQYLKNIAPGLSDLRLAAALRDRM